MPISCLCLYVNFSFLISEAARLLQWFAFFIFLRAIKVGQENLRAPTVERTTT